MSLLRVRYLLTGLAVAAAFLLGAICDWGQLPAVIAALTPAEALLGVMGFVLTAMTGAVGVLIAADVRADMAAAQAWREISAETAVIATPAETAPTDYVDGLYIAGPQDEGLRRILLAYRFVVPAPPSSAIGSLAPKCDDVRAVAQPTGTTSKPELQAVGTISAADGLGDRPTSDAATQRKLGPHLISSNPISARGCNQHHTRLTAFAPRRVANAGSRWEWPVFAVAASARVAGSDFAYDEIVLADRNGRGENAAPNHVAPEQETTVQPCCRGPPRGTSRRHVANGPAHLGKAFRETDRSRANSPVELVVTDNLGDRVPVCQAELEVLEAYLEDVLRDVLGEGNCEPVSKAP